MIKLSQMISKETVLFLDETDRKEVIKKLCQSAFEKGKVPALKEFETAVLDRESLLSSGIGLGVAIPHAKLEGIPEFFIVIGVMKEPVNWDSIDNAPVRLILLIGGPKGNQPKYLQTLATITLLIKNSNRKQRVLNAKTAEEVIDCFNGL